MKIMKSNDAGDETYVRRMKIGRVMFVVKEELMLDNVV